MKVSPLKTDFENLTDTCDDLYKKLNKYKESKSLEDYKELIEAHKDYRVAWIQLQSYVYGALHGIYENEHILVFSKIYDEQNSRLVQESTLNAIDRNIGVTKLFLARAKGQAK